jgi:hypothetical protein
MAATLIMAYHTVVYDWNHAIIIRLLCYSSYEIKVVINFRSIIWILLISVILYRHQMVPVVVEVLYDTVVLVTQLSTLIPVEDE